MAESKELTDLPNQLNEDLRLNLSPRSPRSLLQSYESEKKAAKDLDAKWSDNAQAYFAPEGADPNKFRQWITPADRKALAGETLPLPSRMTEKLRLHVSGSSDRREAKRLGAKKLGLDKGRGADLWMPAGANPNDFTKWISPADKMTLAGAELPLAVRLTKNLKLTASREEGKPARAFGARWDKEEGAYIAPVGTNPNDFLHFLTTEEKALRAVRLLSLKSKARDLRPASRVIESERLNSGQLDDNAVRLVAQWAGLKEQASHLGVENSAAIADALREEMEAYLKDVGSRQKVRPGSGNEVRVTKQDHDLDLPPSYEKIGPNAMGQAFNHLIDVFSARLSEGPNLADLHNDGGIAKQPHGLDGPPPAYEEIYPRAEEIDPKAIAQVLNHLSDAFFDKARPSQDVDRSSTKQGHGLADPPPVYSGQDLIAIAAALSHEINTLPDQARLGTKDRLADLGDEARIAEQIGGLERGRKELERGRNEPPPRYSETESDHAIAKALSEDNNPPAYSETESDHAIAKSLSGEISPPAYSETELDHAIAKSLSGEISPPAYSETELDHAIAKSLSGEISPPAYSETELDHAIAKSLSGEVSPPAYSETELDHAIAKSLSEEISPLHDHAEPRTDASLDDEALLVKQHLGLVMQQTDLGENREAVWDALQEEGKAFQSRELQARSPDPAKPGPDDRSFSDLSDARDVARASKQYFAAATLDADPTYTPENKKALLKAVREERDAYEKRNLQTRPKVRSRV